MRVPPAADGVGEDPTWRFLAAGVEQRRSATLVRAAAGARDGANPRPGENGAADRALHSLPGVGPWTSAEVRQRAHGDADAWSIHDYHVAKDITYALVGEPLDDAACLEILEPYRGHRYRVQLLLSLSAARRPRRAPRRPCRPTRRTQRRAGRSLQRPAVTITAAETREQMSSRATRIALVVVGAIAVVTGGVWIGQGLNLIPGSVHDRRQDVVLHRPRGPGGGCRPAARGLRRSRRTR